MDLMTANDRDAARGATESDENAPGVLGDVPPVSGAREARYAEAAEAIGTYLMGAMAEATVGVREVDGWEKVAAREAAQQWLAPLVDAEHAELKAEVERLKRQEGGQTRASQRAWHTANFYREHLRDAEAALTSEREAHAGLRARLEALADEWERNAYRCTRAGDCPVCVTYQGVVIGLRRALAAGPAEATASRPPETSGAGSIAPVAAEEGGEQEAGEYVRHDGYLSTPATAQCSGCGRLTWDAADDDLVCGMPQPDGRRCSGIFIASRAPSGSDEQEAGEATAESIRREVESLEVRLAEEIEREKNTPHCPYCGSDDEPLESSKDGSLCPHDFHTAPSGSDDTKGGE